MLAANLPTTKFLILLRYRPQLNWQPAPAYSFPRAELLSLSEVRAWLAKYYELESFENKLPPKVPSQATVLIAGN